MFLNRFQRIFLYGCGRSNQALGVYLEKKGISFYSWDDHKEMRQALNESHPTWPLYDLGAAEFLASDLIVFSPGIKRQSSNKNSLYKKALRAGAYCCCDVDLFMQLNSSAIFLGVTGTNGKSTTVCLLSHVLDKLGYNVTCGGNIGIPIFERYGFDIYVLELSSFQLELMHTATLAGAILLNISPDHLDYHGSIADYISAKSHIFKLLKEEGVGLLSEKSLYTASLEETRSPLDSVASHNPFFEKVTSSLPSSLRGAHSYKNVHAVYELLARVFQVSLSDLLECLPSFEGLPHRQQKVACFLDVDFINDSKATNVAAALKALEAFESLYWLVGGVFKEGMLEKNVFKPYRKKIKKVYCYGRDANIFYEHLNEESFFVEKVQTMQEAIEKAWQEAKSSGQKSTILLAPCCASFDAFKDYEERGQVFSEISKNLIEMEMPKVIAHV